MNQEMKNYEVQLVEASLLEVTGKGDNPLWQKLLLWDGLTMTQRLMRYRADAHCPICG